MLVINASLILIPIHATRTANFLPFKLKTLFNIVEERLKKKLNFDVSAV